MQPAFRSVIHSTVPSSIRLPRPCILAKWHQSRNFTSYPAHHQQEAIPLRKHLKDEQKRRKATPKPTTTPTDHPDWELTVGIEIHAELNTQSKLFSPAPTSPPTSPTPSTPNTRVSPFDAALPGTQPTFTPSTLLPALRAALALNCTIHRKSSWDRKHYFHWDQPNGYQITQYYSPFATNGSITLTAEDEEGGDMVVGIKQIQMEQDTGKTTQYFGGGEGSGSAGGYHVDLNRAGVPLIEVISLPVLHSVRSAGRFVRKVQGVLKSVGACVVGMEMGGLRADVNVSVRRKGEEGGGSYAGVEGLGVRTEIKNLSSFKAVEDAIVAERDRQIRVLEGGGVVEGETRGWSLGATETTRLRGKEGEVDYRYMPDADLPPLIIGEDLVDHLRKTLPELPDQTVDRVMKQYELSLKDARSLVALDDGDRLEYMEETVDLVSARLKGMDSAKIGKTVGNWVLHELGGLLTKSEMAWDKLEVQPQELADIISNLLQKQITIRAAKQLLSTLHETPAGANRPTVEQLTDEGGLRLQPLSEEEYTTLAQELLDANPQMVSAIKDKKQKGKIMWFVGQMIRTAKEGTIEPETARKIFEKLLAS